MPEQDAKGGKRIQRGFSVVNILLAIVAASIGYYFASRLDWFYDDHSAVMRRFTVMNTEASIIIPSESGSSLTPSRLADLAEQAIRDVDFLMSPVGDGSDIKRLNSAKAGEWVEVSPLTWTVVMEALRWHRLTEGAFDPTIGPVKKLFNFNREELENWPDPHKLSAAKELVGADKILFEREGMRLAWQKDGMRLDLGAIAKGFGVDRAIEVLLANSVKNALVDIGGEIRTIGQKPDSPSRPWTAGIQNPRGEGFITLPDISNKALATSGDYNQYFIYQGKRYEHIIDPRSGLPLAEEVAGLSIIHPDSCMMADALATTLCVLGREEGRKFLTTQALSLFKNGVIVVMLITQKEGGLRRVDFVLDGQGGLIETESIPEFISAKPVDEESKSRGQQQ